MLPLSNNIMITLVVAFFLVRKVGLLLARNEQGIEYPAPTLVQACALWGHVWTLTPDPIIISLGCRASKWPCKHFEICQTTQIQQIHSLNPHIYSSNLQIKPQIHISHKKIILNKNKIKHRCNAYHGMIVGMCRDL